MCFVLIIVFDFLPIRTHEGIESVSLHTDSFTQQTPYSALRLLFKYSAVAGEISQGQRDCQEDVCTSEHRDREGSTFCWQQKPADMFCFSKKNKKWFWLVSTAKKHSY